jgi:hypothetical protein
MTGRSLRIGGLWFPNAQGTFFTAESSAILKIRFIELAQQ